MESQIFDGMGMYVTMVFFILFAVTGMLGALMHDFPITPTMRSTGWAMLWTGIIGVAALLPFVWWPK